MLYPGYAALRADTLASCGTRSKLSKVVAYTRAGSHRDIPADIPGSAYYVPPGSPSQEQVDAAAAGEAPRAKGFKVVGAFKRAMPTGAACSSVPGCSASSSRSTVSTS